MLTERPPQAENDVTNHLNDDMTGRPTDDLFEISSESENDDGEVEIRADGVSEFY